MQPGRSLGIRNPFLQGRREGRPDQHFVAIPKRELQNLIPRGSEKRWDLYLWVHRQNGAIKSEA